MAKKNKAPKFDAQSELSTLITSFLTRADEAGKTLEDVVAELQGGEAGAGSDFDRDAVIAELAALKIKGLAKKTLNKKTDEELAELYEEHVTPASDESGSDESGSDESGSDESGSDESGSDESGSDESGSDESGSDESGSDESGSDESGSDSDESGSDSESDSDESGSDESGSDSDESGSDELSIDDMREYLIANKIEKKAKVKKLSDDEVEELYEEHAESDESGSDEDGSWESDED